MFTKIKLRNFQSLADVTLDLGKITVIIGPSFLGKSVVVRALNTLIHNRFNSSYMRRGTNQAVVELHEGDRWVRYNKGQISSYRFSDNPEPFTKMGRDVPQEIKDFLNMEEIQFDQDLSLDFNIQKQFDTPFIIGLSGFEVAKVFGKMMNLDIVLAASRKISRDILAKDKEITVCDATIDVTTEYLQHNRSVKAKYSLLQEALLLQDAIDQEVEQLNNLMRLMAEYQYQETLLTHYEALEKTLNKQNIAEFELPPEHLQDVLYRLVYQEKLLEIYKPIVEVKIPDFDTQSYLKAENLIVNSELINRSYVIYAQLLIGWGDIDEDIVDELNAIDQLISDGDRLNDHFGTLKAQERQLNVQIAEKNKAFDVYIEKNNICPISHLPYTPECIAALKE